MAETVLVTVTHSTVLDEPHDISGGGQPARKKSDTGSKSPGKGSWRWGKGSLFKRTLSDQDVSQRAERPPSGKSKTRKESHEGIGNDSPSVGRVSSGSDILGLRPPDPTGTAEGGEGDKGKFGDPKKLYKQNKDLAKANTQLTKLIDTLKHEKDSLALDRSKLKGDLKSTEKELKKAQSSLSSAKSEVERLKTKSLKHSGAGSNMGDGTDVLQERVRQLEAELSSRDEKLEKFRKRLGGRLSQLENLAGNESIEHEASTEKLQDQEQQKLMEENSELRERVVNLESDLNVLLKLVDNQQKEEFAQSSSTEISFFSTDAPSSTHSDLKHGSRQSTSPFSSPRNSPRLQRKNQTSDDIATLRSCLQLALEEKKAAEQQAKSLQTELDCVRAELEEAKRSWGQEKDRLLRQLLKAHEERQRVQTRDHETQHSLTEVASTPEMERNQQLHSQQQSEITSPTRTRGRTSSSGSLTSSSELEKSSESTKSDTANSAVGERKERARGMKGVLKKQQSRENFTAALAMFQSGEGVTLPKKEHRPSDTSPGSARSSMSPAPTPSSSSPKKLSAESRTQSVTIVGKPPIPPSSSSSGHHSRQSSVDETGQKSPTKMSIGAKRSSWAVAQRRKSFEEQSPEPTSTPCHSRTASSPVMTRTLGSPAAAPKATEAKDKAKGEKKFDEGRARREQERRKQELEAEEKRKRELEAKRRREAEEKERQRKEKEEKEGIRREKEERERQRKRELEEKSRREKEEREKKRQEELEKKRKEDERERVRREREERERERKRELEEKTRREKEEREKKRREELERKRQLEQRKKEEEEEKERQKIEVERKRKEEQEAAFKKQRKEEEQKKKQMEEAALKKQREEEEKRKRQEEIENKLRLEEEKRIAEKAAQAAIDPLPSKVNQHQSPFGSIAMRRAAFEQTSNPRNSPPVVLRRNNSPAQRPKSMDISALMSTPPPSSPVASPTPHSPQISSISVKSSKSPQSSPVLQRKEMKEVAVLRANSIPKPSPPVTTVAPRTATVSITTSSSPPLRRAQTLTLTPASLAVSTPDLTSLGSSNDSSSPTHSPSAQHKTTGPRSPQTDRRLAKTVSFSPNLSTAGRPPSILKQSASSPVNTNPHSLSSSVNKMRFGPAQAQLGVPSDDMKKAQSLQNIPEHAMAEDTSPQTATRFTSAASHVTRRPRSERAKTTSLSHADATNLVNLISKLQEKEKAPPLTNGVSNSAANQKTPGFSSPGRPVSMYGTSSRTDVIPSSRKPKPQERKMERRATVGFGLDKSSKKSRLIRWCQLITEDYDNIYIADFGKSFSNGLAFCAILHHFIPHKIPYSTLNDTDRARNFKIAFEAAESEDIPSLLDIEDMVALPIPDWMSVMTYVSFIYKRFGSNGATQQFLL